MRTYFVLFLFISSYFVSCTRTGFNQNNIKVKIVSVTSDQRLFIPGQCGVRITVKIQTDQNSDAFFTKCDLNYSGADQDSFSF